MVLLTSFLVNSGCEASYPEVAVTNDLDGFTLIRNISFNGCKWDDMLAYEDSTGPGRCLPGTDKIHFQKFNAKAYCQEQVDDKTIDGICFCDENYDPQDDPMDSGLINLEPTWFNYQTKESYKIGYGGFHLFEITLDNIEQDFSVVGPYGH